MRVIIVSVLALSLVGSPAAGLCDEQKDEINFNQDPIVTVNIDPNTAHISGRYSNLVFVVGGMLGAYALASWKLAWFQRFNHALMSKFSFLSTKSKSAL